MSKLAVRGIRSLARSFSRFPGLACIAALLHVPAYAQTNDFDLRWGGNVFDVFTIDGVEAWTVEDGGRIRHRDAAGNWTFQNVPLEVKDTIHRVFFLPGTSGAQTGWAVAADGHVLKTTNSGTNWLPVARIDAVFPEKSEFEVLYGVHFVNQSHGWIAGLHGIWYTVNGGDDWSPATLKDAAGVPITAAALEHIEFYELDAVPDLDPDPPVDPASGYPILGLASAEPGLVFRSTNGSEWQVVWNICDHTHEVLGTCAEGICTGHAGGDVWEPWDIEISRHPTEKLALMCGGIVFQCGLIWSSTDNGTTWVREDHECTPCPSPCHCTVANGYADGNDVPDTDTRIFKLKRMRTMYNLDIFDADNSAVAVGYNGQVLRRKPDTGVWYDYSRFSPNYLVQTDAHVAALFGVSTNGATGPLPIAISTGLGGTIQRSVDGGLTWLNDAPVKGEPYRSHDVDFQSALNGWMVGQFSRIASTGTAASQWIESEPLPGFLQPPLHAVAFADNLRGVAVGGFSAGGGSPGQARIVYTQSGGIPNWNEINHHDIVFATSGTFGSLKDVIYVPGTTIVWAAGDKGFIARSNVNGVGWRQVLISGSQLTDFEINGLAFKDTSTGLFVGRDDEDVGIIYQLKVGAGGSHTWLRLDVVPHDPSAPVADIGDVAIFGSDAFAVGETLETLASGEEVRRGIVLKALYTGSASGGSFGTFSPFTSVTQFPKCEVGGNLRGGEATTGTTIPVLNRIAITASGDLWVGGECGRVWRYSSSTWAEYKSQTDTNFLGISFPTNTEGFFVGYRFAETSQALVRYQ